MENTNYDHDGSQTKTQRFNNTFLLVFTPFTVACLLEILDRKRNGIPTTLGKWITLLGAPSRQTKAGRKKASFGNP